MSAPVDLPSRMDHTQEPAAWQDLFVGRAAGDARVTRIELAAADVPSDVTASTWCAALLLLAHRWCGTGHPALAFGLPARRVALPIDPAETAQAWCTRVDQALRSAAGGAHDTGVEGLPLWVAQGQSPPEHGVDCPFVFEVCGSASGAPAIHARAEVADDLSLQALGAALAALAAALHAAPLEPVHAVGVAAPRPLHGPALPSGIADTVHEQFARQVRQGGLAVAVAGAEGPCSFAELDRRSSAMAGRLQAVGVAPGGVVALALDRSLGAIVAMLGVLKAGAAYLPMDAAQPAARQAALLEQAGVAALVVPAAADVPAGWPGAVVTLDDPRPAPAPMPVHVDGDAVAYVMFTSGSTGTPKGIEIRHRSILRLVMGAQFLSLVPGEAMLHAAPLGFDASTLEVWGPLLNGGRCVVHDERLPTAAGLGRTIRDHGVGAAWLTAALFNAVVDDDVRQLAGLRQLLIGGEALSVTHVRRALEALPELVLINGYGPTECTTFTATHRIERPFPADATSVPIGRPITDTVCHVLAPTGVPLPPGLVGELFVGGSGLARGYLGRPDLTAERFVADPFGAPGERLYNTGDHVRVDAQGRIDFIGRRDGMVKLRGLRIELGEIEAALGTHPQVQAAAVTAHTGAGGAPRLVGYVVPRDGHALDAAELRRHLEPRLPSYMLPSAWVTMAALPITLNGKLDRRALPAPSNARPELATAYRAPADALERALCEAFGRILDLSSVGRDDNFFDLGGNSLLTLQLLTLLEREGVGRLDTASFFAEPTPGALARRLRGDASPARDSAPRAQQAAAAEPIAIVAMAGRFPGAADVESFWQMLCEGRDGITRFAPGTLDPAVPAALASDPCYVPARGVIDGVDLFDAAFFGISPREADTMDPQQRVFLELCWECLERAGRAPDGGEGTVGVFAGMHNATYFQRHLLGRQDLIDAVGEFAVMLGNEKDYVATRVANRLDLTGPAVSLNTACSTSLVAVTQAVASLRAGQCTLALAGGVSITCPPRSGYRYEEGSMLSPDGRTRSFDAAGQGTVFSDGAAVVALRRLSDALADGDPVFAVLRGVAVNNDGRRKASFTAPGVDGQAAVIAAAHAAAGVPARSIGYVEAHGTATPLGDPVEVAALTQAFRRQTDERGFCRLGSVKSNVGHTVMAAGATGLIKAALSLAEERIPGTLHFERPNPHIDFAGSPFVVVDRLLPWPRGGEPRRAGVSSFGVGGTNAHVVLEEAPLRSPSPPAEGPQLLLLSARSEGSLQRSAEALAGHLLASPDLNLADVAHTLHVGRSRFGRRLAVVAADAAAAAAALRRADDELRTHGETGAAPPPVVWLFPGQGAQYAGMGRALHAADPAFAAALDEALAAFGPLRSLDLRSALFADDGAAALAETAVTQPATFCIEYALGCAWRARGLAPAAMIGHSVGEFAAAVLAGVMSLADAARLVARRGALMQAQPPGAMLAVRLPAATLLARLPEGLALAAENGPAACVVAGPESDIAAFEATLAREEVPLRRLATSHAFHSPMMDGALAPFEAEVRTVSLAAPQLPIVSTLTGRPMQAADATDPAYWARHLREPVRFSAALKEALARWPDAVFVELGPRDALCGLVRQHGLQGPGPRAVASLGAAPAEEAARWRLAQGFLWTRGIELALQPACPAEGRRRVRLPTYSFDRRRHWVDAVVSTLPSESRSDMSTAVTPARRPRLVAQLKELFGDVSGFELDGADSSARFVEIGLDSLTLTQVALQVKKKFGVQVTFRQLMENHRSFDALAEFLDASLPPEAAPPAPAAPAMVQAAPVMVPAAALPAMTAMAGPVAGSPMLQQLIAQQMQLMSQQLALLQGMPAAAPMVAAPAAPAVVEQVSAAPVAAAPAPASTEAAAPVAEAGPVRYDVKKAFGAIARIHTQAADMTERQRLRLDAFVRRYIERTAKSKAYTVEHRPHLADPRVVNGFRPMTKEIVYQVVIERSLGSRLWDIDGNEYVDVLNGFGMNLFGWQPAFVQDAVRQQLDAGYEIGPQHPLAGEVARLICELTGFERAGLCNTGSEAVMAAVRIARTVTGRNRLVLFAGSYHGTFDEVVVRAGRGGKGIPAAPGIMAGAFGDVQVLEYGTPEALEYIRTNIDDIAAVLVEPVQSRRPDFQPREFLQEVRTITENGGAALIFDEVITGFRAHVGGVQAIFGIRADLATYGKVIGGGFPVGVVAGKREFMDALDGGAWQYGDGSMPTVGVTYFAGTFVRHPLALAACKASLEHLKAHSPNLQTQLNLHTAAMADELSAFCREVGAPVTIRSFASLWRVTWLEDHPLQDLLFAMMRSRGVHILDNFPCFLTTAHTAEDIARIKTAFKESIAELQEAEFLPRRAAQPGTIADASKPPVPNARLGRDKDGKPTWFVPDPKAPGKFMRIDP